MAKNAAPVSIDQSPPGLRPASEDDIVSGNEDALLYEICILYPHAVSQKEEQDVQKAVEGILGEAGGEQVSKDFWGLRGLAYRIKGHDEGRFAVYHYTLAGEKLHEIDEALRITPNVLRHLIVKPPKGYAIVKYSVRYEEWQKSRVADEQQREREKEEELQKRVVERARKQAKKVEQEKKVKEVKKPSADDVELEQELKKLISDDLEL